MDNCLHKISMSPRSVEIIHDNPTELKFDNIFGKGNLRVAFPLYANELNNIIKLLQTGQTNSGIRYIVDIDKELAISQIKTQQGDKQRVSRLGKIIERELGREWTNKYSEIIKGKQNLGNKSIILSRSPLDVLRMSDHNNIKSCHAEGNIHFDQAKYEALNGGLVAYVVNTSDLDKINLQDEEIFTDKERKINGVEPLSRISVHRYSYDYDKNTNNGLYEFAIPVCVEYGKKVPGFLSSLTSYLHNNQAKEMEFLQKNLNENGSEFTNNLTHIGRDYIDAHDNINFTNILDIKSFPVYDLKTFNKGREQTTTLDLYDKECKELLDVFNDKCENDLVSVYFSVEEDEYPYVFMGCSVLTKIDRKIVNKYFDNDNDLLKLIKSKFDLNRNSINLPYMYWEVDISDNVYNTGTNNEYLGIIFNGQPENNGTPDEFNTFCDEVLNFANDEYNNFLVKLSQSISVPNLYDSLLEYAENNGMIDNMNKFNVNIDSDNTYAEASHSVTLYDFYTFEIAKKLDLKYLYHHNVIDDIIKNHFYNNRMILEKSILSDLKNKLKLDLEQYNRQNPYLFKVEGEENFSKMVDMVNNNVDIRLSADKSNLGVGNRIDSDVSINCRFTIDFGIDLATNNILSEIGEDQKSFFNIIKFLESKFDYIHKILKESFLRNYNLNTIFAELKKSEEKIKNETRQLNENKLNETQLNTTSNNWYLLFKSE